MPPGSWGCASEVVVVGMGADRLVLERLRGREKLYDGRARWCPPVLDVSELRDGDRGCERTTVDMGE
jgi:hypothetical protein